MHIIGDNWLKAFNMLEIYGNNAFAAKMVTINDVSDGVAKVNQEIFIVFTGATKQLIS